MSAEVLGSLLPVAVAAPLAGAACAPLLARLSSRLAVLGCVASLLGAVTVLVLAAPTVFSGRVLTHYLGGWTPVRGAALGIAFAADPFGLVFALLAAGVGTLLLIYTLSELGGLGARELGGYAALFQLLLAGLIGVALTADLMNLFVWFEVAALASYGLTGFYLERPFALEAAFKILLLTTIAGFAVFIAVGLLYSGHGALNFGQLHDALARRHGVADAVALSLLIAGFATKAGLVPFHGWLADAHTAAPGPVSALFSGLMVNLGVVAIGRVALQIFPAAHLPVLGALMVLGLASALIGALLALAQDDLKRLLSYDTVSQTGVMAVGLATATPDGAAGAAYHLINHGLFKALLFLCAGAIVHRTGETSLSRMGGLSRDWPALTAMFLVGVASIAGIPPFNGYVSLSLIHQGLLGSGQDVPYALLLLSQLITIAALGRATWLAFLRPRERGYERHQRLRPGMAASLTGLAGCCVAFGVLPRAVLDHAVTPAAASLLHPQAYAHSVLSGSGAIPATRVDFHYLDAKEIVLALVTLGLAVLGARVYLRRDEPALVRALRALQNGSANDYAGYAAAGTALLAAAMCWF